MNVEECYSSLHGNYKEAKSRLMSDKIIAKFLVKFLADKTMPQLLEAVDAGDIEASFISAHTLKGVAANLAFTQLQKSASELTEQLRSKSQKADATLVEAVKQDYKLVIDTINTWQQTAE